MLLNTPSDLSTIDESELKTLADDAHAFEIACRIELHARGVRPAAIVMDNRPRWARAVVSALDGTSPRQSKSFSPRMLIVALLFAALLSLPALVKFGSAFVLKLAEAKAQMEQPR